MSTKNVQRRSERFRLALGDDGNIIIPLDKEGKYDYGAVQRHFRIFEKGWTTEELSIRYAEALKLMNDVMDEESDVEVTARWIRLMEQKNRIPIDPTRRWILAILLGIPATSFGLVPLDNSLIRSQELEPLNPKEDRKTIDIAEYKTFLQSSWTLSHAMIAKSLLGDVISRTERLHNELLYVSLEERKQMMRVLCDYHQLYARITGDQMHLQEAVNSMNKAYRIAKLLKSHELQALVLFRRGYIYLRNGYTNIAVNDFDAAMLLLPHISQPLKGAVLLAVGQGHAFIAQTEKDKTLFLALIDEAYNNIGKGDIDEHEHFMGFDEASYMSDRATTLTGSPVANLRNANEASLLISQLNGPSASLRRQTAISRIEAKVYLDTGYPKMAAARTIEALNSMFYAWNITDSTAIYQRLKDGKYGDMKEITDLGLALFKTRRFQLTNEIKKEE